jgi:hypothetical protein
MSSTQRLVEGHGHLTQSEFIRGQGQHIHPEVNRGHGHLIHTEASISSFAYLDPALNGRNFYTKKFLLQNYLFYV